MALFSRNLKVHMNRWWQTDMGVPIPMASPFRIQGDSRWDLTLLYHWSDSSGSIIGLPPPGVSAGCPAEVTEQGHISSGVTGPNDTDTLHSFPKSSWCPERRVHRNMGPCSPPEQAGPGPRNHCPSHSAQGLRKHCLRKSLYPTCGP